MPEHKGISCELQVEGSKATEYQVTTAGSICSSHIISQEDKLFSFHLNINSPMLGGGGVGRLDLELWADGQKLDGFTFTETNYLVDDAQIQDMSGTVKVVKLRFAKLETVDEKKANMETRQDILTKLGTLEIKIWRAHQDITQTNSLLYQQPSTNPIHEKSIKGESITHCTKLADAKPVQNPSSSGYLTRKVDSYETPWVTFIFRHASKSLLEAAGIIPKEKKAVAKKTLSKNVAAPITYRVKIKREHESPKSNKEGSAGDNSEGTIEDDTCAVTQTRRWADHRLPPIERNSAYDMSRTYDPEHNHKKKRPRYDTKKHRPDDK
ncbi:hypothetical protein TWF481_008731 [Arthrobotrys musiformis]|uniref:DUF7918 domain-containing protein n=1 Tax=Arthrobotrys musiformis TaxID=47236 RepID=A0AAV9W819_9PEZI